MPFKFLFRFFEESEDGFTQREREAIVDVLHYCMYADQHAAVPEDEMIKAVTQTLSWKPGISYETYEDISIAAAREAIEHPDRRAAFFGSLSARLKPDSKALALQLATKVVNADGLRKPEELTVLEGLRTALTG